MSQIQANSHHPKSKNSKSVFRNQMQKQENTMNHTMISKALDYSRVAFMKNLDLYENEKKSMTKKLKQFNSKDLIPAPLKLHQYSYDK